VLDLDLAVELVVLHLRDVAAGVDGGDTVPGRVVPEPRDRTRIHRVTATFFDLDLR